MDGLLCGAVCSVYRLQRGDTVQCGPQRPAVMIHPIPLFLCTARYRSRTAMTDRGACHHPLPGTRCGERGDLRSRYTIDRSRPVRCAISSPPLGGGYTGVCMFGGVEGDALRKHRIPWLAVIGRRRCPECVSSRMRINLCVCLERGEGGMRKRYIPWLAVMGGRRSSGMWQENGGISPPHRLTTPVASDAVVCEG